MRLLLIDEDPRYRVLLRHHLSCHWPDAEVVAWNPVVRGALAPEFLAQGFSAVLLADAWTGGDGLEWLQELRARSGFAPILLLASAGDAARAAEALQHGACAVIDRAKIEHARLVEAVRAAAEHQRVSLAEWRASPEGREARRFGVAEISGYRRIRRLAVGSVSSLYLAEGEQPGALVVLKVTEAARAESGVDQSFDRFLQEYEIVRRIRHPNVVRLYDLGVADDHAYVSMEYFPRGDLRRRMRAGLDARAGLGFALEIARTLAGVHAAGVLHRDLKPGNVMLRDDQSIALIDFGLARQEALAMEITDPGLIFGTPHYMSPEQGHGEPVDERSDLYSLGVICYEMLTGRKPFDAANPMAIVYLHRKGPVPRLPRHLAAAQPVIDRLLAKDPDDRCASAVEAAQALEAALAALSDRDLRCYSGAPA